MTDVKFVRHLSSFHLDDDTQVRFREVTIGSNRVMQLRRFSRGDDGEFHGDTLFVHVPWSRIEAFATATMMARKRSKKDVDA